MEEINFKRVFLTAIIILFLFSNSVSALYFPLKIGNKFIYHYHYYLNHPWGGSIEDYDYICKITKDTIMNSKRYYWVQNYYPSSSYWFRVDSLSGSLYRYDSTNSCIYYNFETLIDSLLMPLNGWSNSCSYIQATTISNVTKWNISCTEKRFYKEGGLNWQTQTRIYNSYFGPVIRSSTVYQSSIEYGSSYTLKGCVIDGVVYGDTILIKVLNINSEVPEKFFLHQNYPNPFNPSTNIKFDVAKSGPVKLTVFDITGREVQTLVSENLQAGTYEATFDASGLNSGVYFYKLIASNFNLIRKMLFVK